ncbi:MAG TPA: hypothetical protein VMW69_01300 [Spirochaetia bacterium]|nr:hypothetical protein [Spirochaetia bacterium]
MRIGAAIVVTVLVCAPLFGQSTSTQDQTAPPAPQTPATDAPTESASTPATTDGQTAPAPPSGSTTAGAAPASQSPQTEPAPYSPTEFPAWARELRRGEIITIGAFPITLLVSSLGFQMARYVQNGFSQAYAPALIGSGSTPLTTQQRTGIILSAVGISALIAVIDFGLGKIGHSK